MSSNDISSFLSSEIFENGQIVTFRSLSRQKLLHVNDAKNKLADFYADRRSSSRPAYAVFQVSGEVTTTNASPKLNGKTTQEDENAMAVDDEEDKEEYSEAVLLTKNVLVGESSLEQAKTAFSKVTSCHIYSLSATPIHNPLQLCEPTSTVRQIDASSGDDFPQIVGRVVSGLVRSGDIRPPVPVASSSKFPARQSASSSTPQLRSIPSQSTLKTETKAASTHAVTEKPKPKATGKLDWGKAKIKEQKSEKLVKIEAETSTAKPSGGKDAKGEKPKASPAEKFEEKMSAESKDTKRGVKRKSDASESSERSVSVADLGSPRLASASNGAVRTKKGIVLSESEESDAEAKANSKVAPARSRLPINPLRKARSQSIATDSDAEKSVRAMFDIDDAEVIKVSRPSISKPPPQSDDDEPVPTASEPEADVDVDMNAENDASEFESAKAGKTKSKPRKRKEQKEVPLGRNGLRKKRVVKSRMTMDAKGYMVTEDYSSFESVDEEEPEPAAKSKSRTTTTNKAKLKTKPSLVSTTASSDDEDAAMIKDTDFSDTEAESSIHPFRTEPAAKPKPTKTYTGKSSASASSGTAGKKAAGGKASPATGQSNLMSFFGKPKK